MLVKKTKAIKNTYGKNLISSRKNVLNTIEKLSSMVDTKGIDYKKLVENDRKLIRVV